MDEIDLPKKKRQKVYNQTGTVDDIAYIRNKVRFLLKENRYIYRAYNHNSPIIVSFKQILSFDFF